MKNEIRKKKNMTQNKILLKICACSTKKIVRAIQN